MIPRMMMQTNVIGKPSCRLSTLNSPAGGSDIMPPVVLHQLPNGMNLYVAEHHRLPVASLLLLVKNGAETDPRGKEGISSLMMEGLLLGAGKRNEDEIALALDSLGAPVFSASGWDAGWIKAQCLSGDLETLMEIVRDMVCDPAYPSEAFQLLKERRLGALKHKQQELSIVVDEAFESVLFKDEPYGHPVDGTIPSIKSISVEDVRSHYAKSMQFSKMAVAVVGDVRAGEVIDKIGRLFTREDGALPAEERHEQPPDEPSGRKIHLFHRPGFTQCHIRMGHLGISRDHPAYHAVQVMNYILGGGGFSSRLMEEIRVKRGYTYGISSGFKARKRPGPFVVSTFTTPEVAPDAVNRIVETIESFQKNGAAGEELESAHGYYTGSFPLALETPSRIAGKVLETELYDLGISFLYEFRDRIRAVGLEDVHQTALSCLRPGEAVIAVAGDLEKSIQAWERIGPVQVIQDTEGGPQD